MDRFAFIVNGIASEIELFCGIQFYGILFLIFIELGLVTICKKEKLNYFNAGNFI